MLVTAPSVLFQYDQEVLSTGSDVTLYCVRECAQGSMRVQQVNVCTSDSRLLNITVLFPFEIDIGIITSVKLCDQNVRGVLKRQRK